MDPAALRGEMVDSLTHDSKALLDSDRIERAMRAVPRHEFVDEEPHRAYLDQSFEHRGTAVLAPGTVARLMEALDVGADDSVLVVGAGVGYTAAVAAEITDPRRVQAIDITRRLVLDARSNLASAGYREVLVDCRDGADGLPEYAPFDRVLVEAAGVEPPAALRRQLAPDGRLVMPLGTADQTLTAIEGDRRERHGTVAFRPLLVEGEQYGSRERNRTAREDRERAARAAESRAGWEHDWIDWDQH